MQLIKTIPIYRIRYLLIGIAFVLCATGLSENNIGFLKELTISDVYYILLLLPIYYFLFRIIRLQQILKVRNRSAWAILFAIFIGILVLKIFPIEDFIILKLRTLDQDGEIPVSSILMLIFVVAVLVIISAPLWKLIKELPKNISKLFLIAGIIFLTGFIAVEFISEIAWTFTRGKDDSVYHLFSLIEVFLEQTGLILFVEGLIYHHRNLINHNTTET